MNEPDVIYRYTNAALRAESLGLSLSATRADFVLRDGRCQMYSRTANLDGVERALDLRAEELPAPAAQGDATRGSGVRIGPPTVIIDPRGGVRGDGTAEGEIGPRTGPDGGFGWRGRR